MMGPKPAQKADGAVRRRRSREDIDALLCAAAEEEFAEFGFHGATTKAIAERAGVSETLLFRYFGNKEGLFETVVTQPFQALLKNFIASLPAATLAEENNDFFVARVFELVSEHRKLLRAFFLYAMSNGETERFKGFDDYFKLSADQLAVQYRNLGREPDINLDIAVRLGFALNLIAVLADSWLFPAGKKTQVQTTLQAMMFKALSPPAES